MRILVADDDAVSNQMAAALLTKWGYEVESAADGVQAWQAIERRPPALIVLDWVMPELDGLELVRRIRAAPALAGIYIVMVTALDRKDDVVLALQSGANDYLCKPFLAAEFKARISMAARLLQTQADLAARVRELEDALAQVRQLRDLIPICSYCRRVRDDRDFWQQVESYVTRQTGARFSHGICPECFEKVMKDMNAAAAPEPKGESA